MKSFFIIVLFSFSYLAFAQAPQCTINNYRDIVFQDNVKLPACNLLRANLREADLQGANLAHADLRWANLKNTNLQGADLHNAEVSCEQVEYLKKQGLTGFDEPSFLYCLFVD